MGPAEGGTKLLNLSLGPAEGGTSGRDKCFPYHLVFFSVFFLFGRGREKCFPYYLVLLVFVVGRGRDKCFPYHFSALMVTNGEFQCTNGD